MTGTAPSDAAFADAFPPADEAEWRRRVLEVSKGVPFERLVLETYDGIRVQPLYPRASEPPSRGWRAAPDRWEVAARVDHPDPSSANAQARADVAGGAGGLHLAFAGAIGAYGFGVADASTQGIEALLDGIRIDAGIAVEIDLGPESETAAMLVADYVANRRIDPGATAICFGLDPLGAMAASGETRSAWPKAGPRLAQRIKGLAARGFRGPFCVADARLVHAAGGSEAQELAFAAGVALAYWRALEAGGVEVDAARAMIGFRLAADADQFLTIARFRVLRQLWSRIEAAAGLTPRPIRIHAETAWRMMTRRDPWTNILRATAGALSAGLGGADTISVVPFTQALGLPDGFARRLARNTQLILLEESHLGKVADPAAGSGGVEALSDALDATAWALLQEMERAGGIWDVLQDGSFQAKVSAVRAARQSNVARRADPLTGTSDFPDLREQPVAVLMPSRSTTRPVAASGATAAFESLQPLRLAEPFEHLRDLADARAAKTGAQPTIALIALGRCAEVAARVAFAKGVFEAGGIAAVEGDRCETAAAAVGAFVASGARLACLCSTEAIYQERAAEVASGLRTAGAAQVYVAGRPTTGEAALRRAGVSDFIYAGCDVVAVLASAHGAL